MKQKQNHAKNKNCNHKDCGKNNDNKTTRDDKE